MSEWIDPNHINLKELAELEPELIAVIRPRDSAARLLEELPRRYRAEDVAKEGREQRIWEVTGLAHLNQGRFQEALAIFWSLYREMVKAQSNVGRVHKGMPLVWIGDCFKNLGFPLHAKRFYMLTLVEDAIRGRGQIDTQASGIYFRLAWGNLLPDPEVRRYAKRFYELAGEQPQLSLFPEAMLQGVDQRWMTEFPSALEASSYWINPLYVSHLLASIGATRGQSLEVLAEYLMSSMPGCRTTRRLRSGSTDYDVVCSVEGFEVDFRSELGRYFVCECKDWSKPADFAAFAKFCRVLDSIKSRFGVLFASKGISGVGRSSDAEREQLKVFQDRGMVIVVFDLDDLRAIANGVNLIHTLRERYEAVRLDLRGNAVASSAPGAFPFVHEPRHLDRQVQKRSSSGPRLEKKPHPKTKTKAPK